MAKRFTDTDLWDKEWFMCLSPKLKCLVKLVRDKCDSSGVWSTNWTLAKNYVGEPVNESDLLGIDEGRQFKKIDDGKIYCIGFIEFQYGTLSENCAPHKKIIATLKKHGIFYSLNEEISRKKSKNENLEEEKLRVSKGYSKGIYTLKEKEEEKEEDKEEEKEEEKEKEKSAQKIKKQPATPPHLFSEDKFSDFEVFEKEFEGTDYEQFNLKFYHESAMNWSRQGNKKVDWIATVRNFMLRDAKDGKPVLKNQNLLHGSAKGTSNNNQQGTGGSYFERKYGGN